MLLSLRLKALGGQWDAAEHFGVNWLDILPVSADMGNAFKALFNFYLKKIY